MKWLVTGGAGFIGCNVVRQLARTGHDVIVFDDLSRKGARENLEWLRADVKFEFVRGDVRRFDQLEGVCRGNPDVGAMLHLAAQVAVTLSVQDPRQDFEINALGTFNVCEAVRQFVPEAILLNASTNKVYGEMLDLRIEEGPTGYRCPDLPDGVSEERPLDFHSPYGCSKGAGEQYVRDYARVYGLRTVNFRQSCIYGPRQFGMGDQGWIAWFVIASLFGRPLTVYGDGKQVRDALFVDDLVGCYVRAVERIDEAHGQTYNIGGGPKNVTSVLEVIDEVGALLKRKIEFSFADWRPGDQRLFVSDIGKARRDLDWAPTVSKKDGLERLVGWVVDSRSALERAGV